jgi:hypothetical protein
MAKLIKQQKFKQIVGAIEGMLGTKDAGLLIAIVADSLVRLAHDHEDGLNIRSIEIKYNDFYSLKFDCEQNKYVT